MKHFTNPEEKRKYLTEEKIPTLVLNMAVPSIISMLITSFYNMADTFFVGQIGTTATAAVGVIFPLMSIIQALGFTFGHGSGNYISRKLGQGEVEDAKKMAATGFVSALIAGAIFSLVGLIFLDGLVGILGATPTIAPYARQYAMYILIGTPFMASSLVLNNQLRFQGSAFFGMIGMGVGAVLNIALDPLFIFAFDMGVAGAAVATVLSQLASCVYVLCVLFGKKVPVRIGFGGYSMRLIGRILLTGISPFLIIFVDSVMIISMNAVLQSYGGPELGDRLITCATIAQSFMLVVTMPLGGISGGTQTILAFNYGAHRRDRILQAEKHIALLCVGYTTLMFALARLGGGLFVRLFTTEAGLAEEALSAIHVCTLAIIPLGVQYALVDGFTGMAQVKLALPLSAWRKLVYFAALFWLPAAFGARAAFWAEPVSDILGPIASVIIYAVFIKKILDFPAAPRHHEG